MVELKKFWWANSKIGEPFDYVGQFQQWKKCDFKVSLAKKMVGHLAHLPQNGGTAPVFF